MDTNEENESLFDLESPAFIYEEEDSDETEQDESTEEESEESDEESESEPDSTDEESEEDSEEQSPDPEVEETDDEEEVVEESTEPSPLLETISSLVEDGTFEESEEEFDSEEDALRSLIEKKTETAKKEAVEEYLENLPDNVKDYIDIGKKGGDIEKLKELESLPNFKEIPLTDKNQELLVEDMLKMTTKLSDDKIKAKIERYKASGNLEAEAEEAREYLAEYKETQIKEFKEKVDAEEAAKKVEEEKKAKEFEKEVRGLTELKGFKVSRKDAGALYDYITKPVGAEGQTQFEIDDAESPENRFLIPFMMMKGFDEKKLSKKAKSKSVIKIKNKLNNLSDKTAQNKKGVEHGRVEDTGAEDIEWIV